MSWLRELVFVEHTDANVRRRGRLLAIILVALIGILLICIPIGLFAANPVSSFVTTSIVIIAEASVLVLVRRGLVTAAGWYFAGLSVVATIVTIAFGGTLVPLVSLFFQVLTVITAGLVLPPKHIWGVLLLTLACCGIGLAAFPGLAGDLASQVMALCAALILIAAAVISYLGARAMQQALDAADEAARATAEAQRHTEEHARELARQTETLRHAEQQLQELVATLETPTVRLVQGVLLAPLIGALDSRRAEKLTGRLLHDVADQRVRLLVLDIAGVALPDGAVANTLMSIVQAVRLLGCRVVVTGVSPNVALSLTHLGVDLSGIETAQSPEQVIAALPGAPADMAMSSVASSVGA
jgi:anti-anti-sigma regulatory factor